MFDRRARRAADAVAAATLLFAGTAVASTTTWSTAADFSTGALASTSGDRVRRVDVDVDLTFGQRPRFVVRQVTQRR